MKGFLLLLCCVHTLGPTLSSAAITTTLERPSGATQDQHTNDTVATAAPPSSAPSVAPTATTPPSPTTSPTSTSTSSTTGTTSTPKHLSWLPFKPECSTVTLVAGGLALACFILLLACLVLTCHVCRLSRRLRNADLTISSENWMVEAKMDKSKSEAKAEETALLMADVGPTKGDLGNGAAREEEGVNKKDVGGPEAAPAAEGAPETPAPVAEDAPTSQPQDATTSQSHAAAEAVAASSSESPEEAKPAV